MTSTHLKKIAWVTGVNQGIGAAIMQQLLSAQIQVVGFDLSNDQVPAHLQDSVHLCDIKNAAQVNKLCAQLLTDSAPDYFINVAAVLHMDPHEKMAVDDWLDTFAINTSAPFYFMRHLTPYFKQKRSGNIVLLSSNAARVPRMGMAAYGASKAALTHFAKTIALELAPYDIRVNTISPGSTLTPMLHQLWTDTIGEAQTIDGNLEQFKLGIPLKKLASVDDIANAVMFLISDQASHITMQDLVIDGGAVLGV